MMRTRRITINSRSLGFFLLLWAMVIFTGCPQATVAIKLKQAQDLFNEASKQTILDEEYGDYVDELKDIRFCNRFPKDYPSKELTKKLAKGKFGLDQCGE